VYYIRKGKGTCKSTHITESAIIIFSPSLMIYCVVELFATVRWPCHTFLLNKQTKIIETCINLDVCTGKLNKKRIDLTWLMYLEEKFHTNETGNKSKIATVPLCG
jgi:hypothetical protein